MKLIILIKFLNKTESKQEKSNAYQKKKNPKLVANKCNERQILINFRATKLFENK